MSTEPADDLETRGSVALRDEFLRNAVRFTVDRLRSAKARSTEAIGAWEEWRERGRAIRAHTIEHLDFYLARFCANASALGVEVHFAADAAEANAEVMKIVRSRGARCVVKSKSMVSEEIHVNKTLDEAGIEVVETDLGEWIVQLAHETPSHIILPAIHKQRAGIQALFEKEGNEKLSPETKVLAGYARRRLRQKFRSAEVGITGCNFAVAETGSVVLFTNEGNGRMVTTLPGTQIVLMGMERIVPTLDDLEVMANLLPRSATGQKLTAYMNVLSGPRRGGEGDGPDELHVIVVDNGRSRQLGDPHFQEVLNCIRCGACLNVCPVYRHIGGHAYGSVYSGPIGAVLTPLLQATPRAGELANASTLCGACFDACPVKIPLHDMLVELRRRNVERGDAPLAERTAFRLYARVFSSPRLYRWVGWLLRFVQRVAIGDGTRRRWWMRWLGPLRAWDRSSRVASAAETVVPRSMEARRSRRSSTTMMFDLAGKTAVVTGAGSGIGESVALLFAKSGARIVLVDISPSAAQTVAAKITALGGEPIAIGCDVGDSRSVESAFATIDERCGKIDILVNNAGIAHVGNVLDTDEQALERVLRVNVKGVYLCTRAAVTRMVKGGGVILNMASIAALIGLEDRFAYSTSKGAVLAMTRSIAVDYMHVNIRCNCICPARIHTPFVDKMVKDFHPGEEAAAMKNLALSQPMGRMGTPDEVAALALYLCSDEAAFVTGQAFPIDGGTLVK